MRSVWSISEIKRKLHERTAKHENETAPDKAARRTADATVWIAIFTVVLAIVSGITLFEVWQGGADTAKLAQAAVDQAGAAKLQEQRMETISETGKAQAISAIDLAERMKDQADQTKVIADQAVAQAQTASRAAKTAEQQLEASERPWLKINIDFSPEEKSIAFDEVGGFTIRMLINTQNIGRSPAIKVRALAELTPAETSNVRFDGRQQKMCDSVHNASFSAAYVGPGNTIFPGDMLPIPQYRLSLSSTKIALELENPSNNIFILPEKGAFIVFEGDGRGFPGTTPADVRRLGAIPAPGVSVIGCVDYTVEYSGLRHQTMFLYDIQGVNLRDRTIQNGVKFVKRLGSGNSAN